MREHRYTHHNPTIFLKERNTLIELVNTMLETMRLSKKLWGDVIYTSCHVPNRVPINNKEITPFEEL